MAAYTILQLDKATQTDEPSGFCIDSNMDSLNDSSSSSSMKSEKVLRQRLQRVQQRTGEHSVSSQTLSPIHSEYLTIYSILFQQFILMEWNRIDSINIYIYL